MASFLSDIKAIGKFVWGIASNPLTVGVITAVDPPLGAIWGRVTNAITTIEAQHLAAGRQGSGPEKLTFVVNDFNQSLAVTQEILRSQGKLLTYDGSALDKAIADQVTALNSAAKLKASFKIEDGPKS